jgi:hypothetical protein
MFQEPRNHRVTTGWGIRVITGNDDKAENRCNKVVSVGLEIPSNLKKLPTT